MTSKLSHGIFLFSLSVTLLFFSAIPLYAGCTPIAGCTSDIGCSPYLGLATINEVNLHGQSFESSADTFIEIKALTPEIIADSIWKGWTIDICSAISREAAENDPPIPPIPCKTNIPIKDYYFDAGGTLVDGDTSGNPWLMTPEPTFSWPYLDLSYTKNNDARGMSIYLYDENGDLIDFLDVDDYIDDTVEPNCPFIYDTSAAGSNNFNLQRLPDGTGSWDQISGGNSTEQTDNTTNDLIQESAPLVIIHDAQATAGGDIVFTIDLTDPTTGELTTTTTDVIIRYSTIDSTAIAGTDYEDQSGSVTILAYSSSMTIPVPTYHTAAIGNFFYLHLEEVTSIDNQDKKNAIIGFNFGKGTIVGSTIEHYEIHHDGHGLTCQPEAVTIKACIDTLSPCTELSDPASVDLATSAGSWLETNPVVFTGSTKGNLRNTDSTQVPVIGLSSTNPAASVQCYENNVLDPGCDLVFHNSGFIFDVVDAVSGTTQTVTMQSVRLDDTSETCTPYLQSDDFDIDFSFSYTTPNSNPNGSQARINSNDFIGMSLTQTLTFDAYASTSFALSYPDAGELTFTASYDDGEAYATGNDSAIFYPAQFIITANDQSWTATDHNSAILAKAGEDFDVTITAVNSNGDITSNYSGSVSLSATNIGPAGGDTGDLGTTTVSLTNGTVTFDQTYNEVGITTLSAEDSDYQGYTINGTSDNIGRFTPASFNLISLSTIEGSLNHADSGFSYFGHEINGYATYPSFLIEALDVDGSRTVNYRDDFFKLTVNDFSITSPVADKNIATQPISIIRDPATLVAYNDGTARYQFGEDEITYTRLATPTAQIPTPEFDFTVTSISDGDVTTAGLNEPIPVSGGTELRYGRLVIENNFGPETEPITLEIRTEYWDGITANNWVLNDIDNSNNVFSYLKDEKLIDSGPNAGLPDLTTTEDENSVAVTPDPGGSALSIVVGMSSITLTPATDLGDPGGTVDITPQLPSWLKFDWEGDDGIDDNPTATATFGIYRGRDRIISWEELPVH